jgi:hypothetical protein
MSPMSSGENPSADSGEELGASAFRHYTSTIALIPALIDHYSVFQLQDNKHV